MKTNFLKSGLLTLVVSAFAMFALTSCDKDDDAKPQTIIKNQIVGTWDISSFKVDTSEYMGVIVDSSFIKFEAFTGTEGNFQHSILYMDGEQENLSGKYQVDEKKKEVKMIATGETKTVKISFPANNKMEWAGEDAGHDVKVKAVRR